VAHRAYAHEAEVVGRIVGSLHFQAHGLANFAWIAYRQGRHVEALEKVTQACDYFDKASVPFAWIGNMVLLAVYYDLGQLESAVGAARTMLDPRQQLLPDDITTAMTRAVQCWEWKDANNVRKYLDKIVSLAKTGGYL